MERQIPRRDFIKVGRSDPDTRHELVFAVKQNNLDELERIVLDRSNPRSVLYQQWLSFEEIGSMIRNEEGTNAVVTWLEGNEVGVKWKSKRGEYIKAEASIRKWEELLNGTYYEWEDRSGIEKGEKPFKVHRMKEYYIAKSLREHVTAVFNTVQTPPRRKPKRIAISRSENGKAVQNSGDVTVSFLNTYYKIGSNIGNGNQSQSVFETDSEEFSQSDLKMFQQNNKITVQSAINYNGVESDSCTTDTCGEGNLDIQYIMGVAQVTEGIFWYVNSSSGDAFVTWVTELADSSDPPQSNSMSWGEIESLLSKSVMNQFNTEALKLAGMGVTVIVASGDDGAPNYYNNGCLCNYDSSSSQSQWTGSGSWTGTGYFPSFPATSPYVLAVGATMGPETNSPEVACQSDEGGTITTGGGFSTYYAQPSWQTEAVSNYFAALDSADQPTGGYNPKGRGYPDISLVGVNYQVVIGSSTIGLAGTSCVAPVYAAYVSLVNAQRKAAGKSTIGFLNPTLYQYGYNTSVTTFNDVTSGDNKCCGLHGGNEPTCCDSGFYTAKGWDPVTGWGSIDYTKFSAIFDVAVPYVPETNHSVSRYSFLSVNGLFCVLFMLSIVVNYL